MRRPEDKPIGKDDGPLPNRWWSRCLARVVRAMGLSSGIAIVLMMVTTTVDVIGRSALNCPLNGAYDIVRLLGGAALFLSLPYTTAVKGHVAVEFFFHKLGRRSRTGVDAVNRVMMTGLCLVLAVFCGLYGESLRRAGQVTMTLQVPVFPIAYLAAACFTTMALVVLHHMLHPGKELVRP